MERIEVQYVNEYEKKNEISGLDFMLLMIVGFICAVGFLCGCLWVFR